MEADYKIPVILIELAGIDRIDEPVTGGIPIKKGQLFATKELCLINKNTTIPVQAQALSKWPDGSIKWLLLDFKINLKATKTIKLDLCNKKIGKVHNKIYIVENGDTITVNTGRGIFQLPRYKLDLFGNNSEIKIIDNKNKEYFPFIKKKTIETNRGLRTTIKFFGKFKNKENKALLDFIARFNFYSDSKLVKLDFTARNPRAAEHRGGFWDLGDKGSVLFKDLSLRISANNDCDIFYKNRIKKKFKEIKSNILIYQDSSGNKNWKSKNHVNRNNKVMNTFKGYKIYSKNKKILKGNHAQPTIKLKNKNFSLSVSIRDFWQNFPKAIQANKNEIIIRLFPKQYNDLHELQGGEQKTHTIFFDFSGNDLDWIQQPLLVASTPEYYSDTEAIPYLTPINKADKRYQKFIDCAIKGNDSFDKKNEIIDEYGWRNFGELYADHEAIHQKGLISHYNNQYDVICGALLQFFRSNNPKWFEIANNLARHVSDIDIYNTKKDKPAYNGGLFWHTFHYMGVATCTHRCYSKLGIKKMSEFSYGVGGGLNSEHNYATGLMHHYFLTGDVLSKEAVISLANWVINMDDGSKSKLKFLSHKPTGKASCSGSVYYHGLGRGPGNSINVLIDGFKITRNKKYLLKAEELIRRCIHPKDDIKKNNLEDVEHRWSYLVFLQALGRFLDLKSELNQGAYMYYYARKSLINYAKWMLENEVPYKEVLHKVDIPTETWPAHDIRKSNVFYFASKYAPEELAKRFRGKSEYFFSRCIEDLNTFKTKSLLRPLAIMINFSVMHSYSQQNPNLGAKFIEKEISFGKHKKFKPQGYYFYKMRDMFRKVKSKL